MKIAKILGLTGATVFAARGGSSGDISAPSYTEVEAARANGDGSNPYAPDSEEYPPVHTTIDPFAPVTWPTNYNDATGEIDSPCGISFYSTEVRANAECTLELGGFPFFLTLGGVFVTNAAAAGDDTFTFHTYDNWQGSYGANVVIFWENYNYPDDAECLDESGVTLTCVDSADTDGDGKPDAISGVYLGNFMHDFRHAAKSNTCVPIANSDYHCGRTVYEIELADGFGNQIPVDKISVNYHTSSVGGTAVEDAYGNWSADDGKFQINVGEYDFNGQFLYFCFENAGDLDPTGWYSSVTLINQGDCGNDPPHPTHPPNDGGDGGDGGYGGDDGSSPYNP